MPNPNDVAALWLWPWTIAQASLHMFETFTGAHSVISARLPLITAAQRNPWTADHKELTRMVTEKADAFGLSHRAMTSAGRKLQTAAEGNARDLGKLNGGTMLGPNELLRMAERSLGAWTALIALPGEALAPVHRRVTANAARLK